MKIIILLFAVVAVLFVGICWAICIFGADFESWQDEIEKGNEYEKKVSNKNRPENK